MTAVCVYFQVHQPYRLRPFSVFDISGTGPIRYFDDAKNEAIMRRVAEKCYRPVNAMLLELIQQFEGRFEVAFSITGTALDQFEQYAPDVLTSFQALAATGAVELVCETDNHSLSALFSWDELVEEVERHRARITALAGTAPTVFRNTELMYCDELARSVEALGFSGVLTDGVPRVLAGRTPGHAYRAANTDHLVVLTKNPSLSDDIAFRFSDRGWSEWPLTAATFAGWVRALDGSEETVNLFMDYETFGEHQWSSTGVLDFLRALPGELLRYPELRFATPRALVRDLPTRGVLTSPEWISWADADRDLSAWQGNSLQVEAARSVYELRDAVRATGDPALTRSWRRLLTSDHFYFMSLKRLGDGEVHRYFSPYDSPYDAYIYFMNVVNDLRLRCGLDRSAGRAPVPVGAGA